MDSREHAGSSSSPSDSVTITEVERQPDHPSKQRGAGGGKTKVLLSDGSSFFVRTSLWIAEGVDAGDIITQGRAVELAERSEAADAYDHGVRLLTRRDHAAAELGLKLKKRGYSQAAVGVAIARLEAEGYVDDLRFASAFVEQRLRRHPEAPSALRARLSDRGVEENVVSQALSSVMSEYPDLFDGAVYAAAAKLARKSDMTNEKIARSLGRRGFRMSEIIDALKFLGRSGEIFPKNQELS